MTRDGCGVMTESIRRYCLCGASCTVRSTPRVAAENLAALFDRVHSGPGHGPATARQASNARRRREDQWDRHGVSGYEL